MKTIVLTGGGTAGHIMPNIALIPYLNKDYALHYIGTSGMEKDIITKSTTLPFHEITSAKLVRSFTLKNLAIPFKLFKGIRQAKKILKQLSPVCVFSKGGFVAVPVVIAAKKLKIPVVSHESDFSLGLANKICAKFSVVVCTSFYHTATTTPNGVYTGSPIRQSLYQGKKQVALKECNFETTKPVLLIFGGSLGAKPINEVIKQSLTQLVKTYNIVHIVGKNNLYENPFPNSVYLIEFTHKIEHFFALADYVVCRSGSNAIFELLALQKPMLLIPLPKGSSRGDQIENANEFKKHKFAHVLFQENLNSKTLLQSLSDLQKNKDNLVSTMKKSLARNGCENIVLQIKRVSKK